MTAAELRPDLVNPGAWDATRLRQVLPCARRGLYAVVYGLERRGAPSVDLAFGKAAHAGWEAGDRAGPWTDPATVREAQRAALVEADAAGLARAPSDSTWDGVKNRTTLVRVMAGYGAWSAGAAALPIAEVDGAPGIERALSLPILGGAARLVSRPDGFVRWEGAVWVRERKTTKRPPGAVYDAQWRPSLQVELQAIVGGAAVARDGLPFGGVILESAHLAPPGGSRKLEFRRVELARDRAGLAESAAELVDAVAWVMDRLMTLRDGPPEVNAPAWPKNLASCERCAFRDVCAAAPAERGGILARDFAQRAEPWDPEARGEDRA